MAKTPSANELQFRRERWAEDFSADIPVGRSARMDTIADPEAGERDARYWKQMKGVSLPGQSRGAGLRRYPPKKRQKKQRIYRGSARVQIQKQREGGKSTSPEFQRRVQG